MTSRPGPGIQESLQHRGGGPPQGPVRRVSGSQHVSADSTPANERVVAEERVTKSKGKGKPVKLEGIQTTVNDSVRQPPKGKPQLFFGHVPGSGTEIPSPSQFVASLPVPPRPGTSLPGEVQRILPGGTGVKETPGKTQGSETAAPAVLFPGGKTADLFPWTGSHAEDVLSEALVKGGISNKSQIMNETNTARPSLWSNLKNKSGISTLSTLFVAVLEKRQSCGRLTAPNAFKPPPRLTLRDSTREAWLHDLANPTVGLRRLSRTIPHGITGKVLLDQCLNKNIPIPRALWLAKCVGINEMRAHKRKGQAGTITWVRGWTSSVEQFMDGTIATIGQQEWKPRITYALQLATHLFKEHLLEEDHFLDWILKSLDSCSQERLFLWLLIVSLPNYWPDLTSSRRRGRRLAESLLNHAEKLYRLDGEGQTSPLLGYIENSILKLVVTTPACLLLPKTWERHGPILRTFAQRRAHVEVTRAVNSLDERNQRITRPSNVRSSMPQDSAGRLYRLLDAVDYSVGFSVEELAFDCMDIISDARQLISTLLQWASSLYRQGSHRIYLATRLLRKWNHLGADVYDGILACLPSIASDKSKEPHLVFRIVAELVRSKTFSIGRYLQWLIATGSLSHHQDLYSSSAWPLRLLTEIPLSGLSEQIHNLRYTLLRGTVYSADVEDQVLDSAEAAIRQQLLDLCDDDDMSDSIPNLDIAALSPTVRLEIGIWLRQQVATTMDVIERVPTKDPSVEETGTVCRTTVQDFNIVRSYLERFDDLSILADVVGLAATSLDSGVLSAVADTLHYHYKAFRAIGAFEPLFEKIAMRYAAIRTVRFPERELLLGLSDLARTAHADGHLAQLLNYDLSRYDLKNSIAACSPVSDTMGELSATLNAEDEIERILTSGTSMDQQMMSRLFGKITHHLEEQLCKGSHQFENFPSWFYRLRNFDEGTFDMILSSWLGSLLMSHQRDMLSAALPPLVASSCLTLTWFRKTIQECIRSRQSSQPREALRIAIEGLDSILPTERLNQPCQPQDAYRYRLEQYKFCEEREGGILELIHDLVGLDVEGSGHTPQKPLFDLLSSNRLLNVLRHFAISDMQSLSTLIGAGKLSSLETGNARVKLLFDRLVDPVNHLGLSKKTVEQQVTTIVESTNGLTLPFCQLALQQIYSMNAASTDNTTEDVSAALLIAVKMAVERDQPSWSDLLSGLEADVTGKIREHAERAILNASAFFCDPTEVDTEQRITDEQAFIRKYLTVIDFTSTGTPTDGQAPILVSLIERFKGIAEALTKGIDTSKSLMQAENTWSTSSLCLWLNALLHLAVAHGPVLLPKASTQHQAALLRSLRTLVTHATLKMVPSLAQYAFDVAMLLSDSVSDDVRKHLAQLDAIKAVGDARCAFIFGTTPPPDGWLILTKPVPSSILPKSASSPQTQPQSSSQGQSPYQSVQQQQQQTPSPAPLQRTLSQQQYQQQLQSQTQNRPPYAQYPQHPQPHKMLPQQLQRMSSNGQVSQLQQLQQMQQMQALAQQRSTQSSPVLQQRASGTPPQPTPPAAGKPGAVKQEKVETRNVPFALRRWEILPESGGNPAGNETAISLSLFGARRV